jgi:hypothetical protein
LLQLFQSVARVTQRAVEFDRCLVGHRVRLGAALRSAAAANLARYDGRAQGLFGTPVGRVDGIGLKEKGKHRGNFDGEMGGESARDACCGPGRSMGALSWFWR